MSPSPRPTEPAVTVGLSGGVDSAVSALLLQRRGARVSAVFMKNWEADDRDGYCAAAEDLADARAVSERLGVPLDAVNFSSAYWDRVFERFWRSPRARSSGSGLGLTIAQQAIGHLGGQVRLGPGLHGRGVGFTLRWPVVG